MHTIQVPICYKITLKKTELKKPIHQKNRQMWGNDPLRGFVSSKTSKETILLKSETFSHFIEMIFLQQLLYCY
jgi:hypothetical protein